MKAVLLSALIVAAAAFGLDFAHLIYHLADTPVLWEMPGVAVKFFGKLFWFALPVALLLLRAKWMKWLMLCILIFEAGLPEALADPRHCRHARELLETAGVARDAKEDFLGRIKLSPPYGTFPSDMDKITWWGSFKPFELWSSPEFKAVWINPEGQVAATQTFRGKKCKLAKTTLKADKLPKGEYQHGMWEVQVTCADYLIDRRQFAVLDPAGRKPQAPDQTASPREEAVTIWAEDMLKG